MCAGVQKYEVEFSWREVERGAKKVARPVEKYLRCEILEAAAVSCNIITLDVVDVLSFAPATVNSGVPWTSLRGELGLGVHGHSFPPFQWFYPGTHLPRHAIKPLCEAIAKNGQQVRMLDIETVSRRISAL